ncbi:hypothetical protein EXIGLDRAFT_723134 [Exidia glandulosa HHB12029]|uniref:Uncharacterized protein n=1 Tax=Exidia glandulosa HHB12029 TaxID=1314781 RepID=A0A165MYZ2_EXIGL|nr:hypothetical protein EXIGLDRAFT_723134 [Exidia glandulosa HHB12029]
MSSDLARYGGAEYRALAEAWERVLDEHAKEAAAWRAGRDVTYEETDEEYEVDAEAAAAWRIGLDVKYADSDDENVVDKKTAAWRVGLDVKYDDSDDEYVRGANRKTDAKSIASVESQPPAWVYAKNTTAVTSRSSTAVCSDDEDVYCGDDSGYETDTSSDDDESVVSFDGTKTAPKKTYESAASVAVVVAGAFRADRHRKSRYIALLEEVAAECDEYEWSQQSASVTTSESATANEISVSESHGDSQSASPSPRMPFTPLPVPSSLEDALIKNYEAAFDPYSPGARRRRERRETLKTAAGWSSFKAPAMPRTPFVIEVQYNHNDESAAEIEA